MLDRLPALSRSFEFCLSHANVNVCCLLFKNQHPKQLQGDISTWLVHAVPVLRQLPTSAVRASAARLCAPVMPLVARPSKRRAATPSPTPKRKW